MPADIGDEIVPAVTTAEKRDAILARARDLQNYVDAIAESFTSLRESQSGIMQVSTAADKLARENQRLYEKYYLSRAMNKHFSELIGVILNDVYADSDRAERLYRLIYENVKQLEQMQILYNNYRELTELIMRHPEMIYQLRQVRETTATTLGKSGTSISPQQTSTADLALSGLQSYVCDSRHELSLSYRVEAQCSYMHEETMRLHEYLYAETRKYRLAISSSKQVSECAGSVHKYRNMLAKVDYLSYKVLELTLRTKSACKSSAGGV